MTESTPAPTSAAAFSGSIVPDCRPICAKRDQQRQGGRCQQHQLHPPAHGQFAPIEQQCGETTDGEEQDEENDQAGR